MDEHLLDLRRVGSDPDHWYPLARSRRLRRGRILPASFAGEPIALVRDAEGAVFALEDRCAHRQVPLSAGAVCGRKVRCGYHGWFYDADGRLKIPYPHDPATAPRGVRSYPCREAGGLIFVFPGAPERAEARPLPDLSRHTDPRYKTRFIDRRVRCHYSFMHENLMDMNHQFLHRRLMGSIRTLEVDRRTRAGRVEVDYTFTRAAGKQPLGERLMLGARPDPSAERPRDLMTITTDYPYQTLRFWTAGSQDPALDLWIVYVPVDREQRENHTFGLMMIKKPGIPGLIHVLWPFIVWFTERIFDEDRWIVEREQEAFDAQGADQNHEVFPVILDLRRLLRERGVPLAGSPPRRLPAARRRVSA